MYFFLYSFALFNWTLFYKKNYLLKGDANLVKPKLNDITNILRDKRFIVIYTLMFTIFFVFAGLLNILPFRIKELVPNTSETQIGLLYLGYGMGIVISLTIHKIVNFFKKELRAIVAGVIVFIVSTALFLSTNALFLFSFVFIFCVGMFTVHTINYKNCKTHLKPHKKL